MTTYNYNSELIKAMNEKLPNGTNLANTLIDMLYLGKEAVYRRLRGEVPFTLAEAAAISQKMGVSLDKLAGTNVDSNAIFDLNIIRQTDPLETYYSIVDNYVKIFRDLNHDPASELCTSSNMIPQTFYLKYELLSKFRMFKWIYQFEKIDIEKHFEDIEIVDKLLEKQREFVRESQEFQHTEYIWDSKLFIYLINDIKYFASVNLISNADVQELKEELFHFLNCLERLAAKGRFDNGNRISFYISNINFDTTYSYVQTRKCKLTLIKAFTLNSVASLDDKTFDSVKNWISSLKRFSTLISESGDLQRIHFFRKQRELVSML